MVDILLDGKYRPRKENDLFIENSNNNKKSQWKNFAKQNVDSYIYQKFISASIYSISFNGSFDNLLYIVCLYLLGIDIRPMYLHVHLDPIEDHGLATRSSSV